MEPEYSDLPAEVIVAAQAGRKLDAIRILREHTGMGLADAKAVVDGLEKEPGSELPPLAAGKEDHGTARFLVILAVLGGIAAALFLL
jgi:hypothetical protein